MQMRFFSEKRFFFQKPVSSALTIIYAKLFTAVPCYKPQKSYFFEF